MRRQGRGPEDRRRQQRRRSRQPCGCPRRANFGTPWGGQGGWCHSSKGERTAMPTAWSTSRTMASEPGGM
eukprot:7751860-Lingulodinium_polyedra.AAC.1